MGERQLIALARALAGDPDIVILDEATSSVDPETEYLLQKAVATLLNGRTALIIAHRLSTIRHVDRILVSIPPPPPSPFEGGLRRAQSSEGTGGGGVPPP